MFIVRCLFVILFATCCYGSNALAADLAAPLASHNFFTPELKPSPDAFKLAKSTFLPETYDDLGLSGRHNTKYDYNKNDCSSYPLSSCPTGGNCDKCPFDSRKLKLNSCNTGYTKSGNSCTKKAVFCETNATTFLNDIPADYICGKVKTEERCNTSNISKSCDKCYSSCYKINCSGYPLDCKTIDKTALHIASTETCANCNSSLSNCTKTYCKITKCEDGYKANVAGTACIEKEDTCPNGYYKSCETGTQGDPKYTERGTACYQCKPKVEKTSAIGDILYSDMTTASEVISGKTPIGIVFNGDKRLAMGLHYFSNGHLFSYGYANSRWTADNVDVPQLANKDLSAALLDWDGKENTKTVLAYCKSTNMHCPAFEYVNNYTTDGTSAGDWYLPALGEVVDICNNLKILNSRLQLVGGDTWDFGGAWSSTEKEQSSAWAPFINEDGTYDRTNFHTKNWVRRSIPVINY